MCAYLFTFKSSAGREFHESDPLRVILKDNQNPMEVKKNCERWPILLHKLLHKRIVVYGPREKNAASGWGGKIRCLLRIIG